MSAALRLLALVTALFLVPSTAQAQVSPNSLRIVLGDGQSVARSGESVPGGEALFAPLAVVLVDAAGQPMSDQQVMFSCPPPTAMACQLDPGGLGRVIVTTDGDGRAVLNVNNGNSVAAYYASGPLTVTASADGADPITFNLIVLDPAPPPPPVAGARMTIVSGDGQTAPRITRLGGTPIALFAPLTVAVVDDAGRPLANVMVSWSCSAPPGMICQTSPFGDPSLTRTDANGNAILVRSSLMAMNRDGAIQVVASHGDASATFNLIVENSPTAVTPAMRPTTRSPRSARPPRRKSISPSDTPRLSGKL